MLPIAEYDDPVDTDLLRTFRAVVETQSFTSAARELGFVQSTVTGHVQALERRLGARLVDRLPSGAVPTDAGRRLMPYVTRLLDLEELMRAEVPDSAGRLSGVVRLVAPESLCAYRLPRFVTALRADAPEVRVSLKPSGTLGALTAVRRGMAEIALLLEPTLVADDLHLEPLGVEPLMLLAARDGVDQDDDDLTWAGLAAIDVLLLEEGCSYSDDVARRLMAAGQPARRRTRFGSIEAVKSCAAAGLGWTVLPTVAAAPELRSRTLRRLAGPPIPAHHVYIATNPTRSLAPAVTAALECLAELWVTQEA